MMGLEEIKKANEDPEKYYRQRLSDGQKALDPPKDKPKDRRIERQ